METSRNLQWIILCCVSLTSCQKRIDYAVANGTGGKITEVKVSIGETHSFEHGILIEEAQKSFGGSIIAHAENQVIISWRDESGKIFRFQVSATRSEILDKRQIIFRIEADSSITKQWRFDSPPEP